MYLVPDAMLNSPQILGMVFGLSEAALAIFKRSGKRAVSSDKGSLGVLWGVILASLVAGSAVARWLPQLDLPAARPLYIIGMITCILGIAIRWYAILYLGRFFTVNVAIADDHRLVQTGPYKYVRHPSYSGALLAFVGLALCSGNAGTLVVTVCPIVWAFYFRIQREETVLREALGSAYRSYAERTKSLIPGLL